MEISWLLVVKVKFGFNNLLQTLVLCIKLYSQSCLDIIYQMYNIYIIFIIYIYVQLYKYLTDFIQIQRKYKMKKQEILFSSLLVQNYNRLKFSFPLNRNLVYDIKKYSLIFSMRDFNKKNKQSSSTFWLIIVKV